MPNVLDANGLQVKSVAEVIASITAALQTVYGPDINVDPNSPDGQLINIFAQAVIDNLDSLSAVYGSMSVGGAFGVALDQRVALNGLTRIAGTYTIQNVAVTVDRALTLQGLDGNITPTGNEFVVADDTGTQFILQTTQVIGGAGTASYAFRAATVGVVQTIPNTITNIVTVKLGVTAVNNPTAATSIGIQEETDVQLRIRHAKNFKLASAGPADSVLAGLLTQVSGVTDAFVEENTTGSALGDGLAAHSIWVIVIGGTNADIANMIYKKRAAGCGMKGSVSVTVSRPNSQTVTIKFDRQTDQNLHAKFGLVAKNGSDSFDNTAIKTALVAALPYKIAQSATIGDVVQAMAVIAPNGYLTAVQVSKDGSSWFDVVTTDDVQHRFVLATSRITIS